MELLKRARTYVTRCTLLLALVTTLSGVAQTRPTAAQERLTQAIRAHIEEAARPDETRMSIEQKPEPHPKDPWTDEQLIRPAELLRQMSRTERPLVLHIGVAFLFTGAHIPGSEYVGPASTVEGIEKLKKSVRGLPLSRGMVLYCGCCPWEDCPNIRPAFRVLREMRFARAKVLYLPNSLGQDWVEKGFPVEKGKSTGGGE